MIGIIGAMDVEIELLVEKISNLEKSTISGIDFYKGFIGDKEVVVVKCGVGKVNAAFITTLLATNFKVDKIISTGIAGAVGNLKRYDIVLGCELAYSDFDTCAFGYDFGKVPGLPKTYLSNEVLLNKANDIISLNHSVYKGAIISSDKFITNLEYISELIARLNLNYTEYAVEMESTAIAQVCYRLNIPFLAIRCISDIVGESNQEETYSSFEAKVANFTASYLDTLIKEL